MACPGSSPSSHREKHPNPKSGRYLPLDKPGYITSCCVYVTDPEFLRTFFLNFDPDPRLFKMNLESSSCLKSQLQWDTPIKMKDFGMTIFQYPWCSLICHSVIQKTFYYPIILSSLLWDQISLFIYDSIHKT